MVTLLTGNKRERGFLCKLPPVREEDIIFLDMNQLPNEINLICLEAAVLIKSFVNSSNF